MQRIAIGAGGARRRTVRAARMAAALVALSAAPIAVADEDRHCVVAHVEGHNGATIVVDMLVINDGKPCTMRRRFNGEPATSTAIRGRPANGTLSSTRSEVAYTPNPGFVGKDAFDVDWFGLGFGPNSKSRSIRTKVEVTVRAASDEPDTAGEESQSQSAKPAQ
ncbi:MAG TPA: Ig-like domain-containing protein [Casimicrobiaceae bacterium]|nr:Ig-like domain-containing protein [Casimicrobiaceae bacterium]